jgi:hypothetical protein
MAKKQVTASEIGKLGGRARAARHSKRELSEWAKLGGRTAKLDGEALSQIEAMLRQGKSQSDCAAALGVSTRTIGRAVARMKTENSSKPS